MDAVPDGLSSVRWPHGWAAYQQAGHEESARPTDVAVLTVQASPTVARARPHAGAQRPLRRRFVPAVGLAVRTLCVLDTHLDPLRKPRVSVPELGTARGDRSREPIAGTQSIATMLAHMFESSGLGDVAEPAKVATASD
jgi:hypothetical protein